MTRLSDAQDRLERALSRLEQASGNAPDRNAAGQNGANAAVTAPVAANVTNDELEQLRARYDNLHGVTRKISDRLDAAVGRMKTALDG